jgi:hypothetical protein
MSLVADASERRVSKRRPIFSKFGLLGNPGVPGAGEPGKNG